MSRLLQNGRHGDAAGICVSATGLQALSGRDHQLADLLGQLILGVGLSELGDVKV